MRKTEAKRMNRHHYLNVRVSDTQYNKIKEYCKKTGVPLSNFIQKTCSDKIDLEGEYQNIIKSLTEAKRMNIKYNEIQCSSCGKYLDIKYEDVLQILYDTDIIEVKCPFCKEINDVVIADCNITLDVEIGG